MRTVIRFLKFIVSFFSKYLVLVDKFIYTTIEDLVSLRNKLILIMTIFMFIALNTKDAAIISIMGTLWASILAYYFHLRQKTSESNPSFKTSDFGTKKETRIESEDSNTPN